MAEIKGTTLVKVTAEDILWDGSYIIPPNITTIEAGAFEKNDALRQIHISSNIKSIGPEAFSFCTNLQKVSFEDGVTDIPLNTFFACSNLRMIQLPNSLEQIGMDAFYQCTSLRSLRLPSSLKNISMAAFASCTQLKEIRISGTFEYIFESAFDNCPLLTNIHIQAMNEEQFSAIFNTLPEALQPIAENTHANRARIKNVVSMLSQATRSGLFAKKGIPTDIIRQCIPPAYRSISLFSKETLPDHELKNAYQRGLEGYHRSQTETLNVSKKRKRSPESDDGDSEEAQREIKRRRICLL